MYLIWFACMLAHVREREKERERERKRDLYTQGTRVDIVFASLIYENLQVAYYTEHWTKTISVTGWGL